MSSVWENLNFPSLSSPRELGLTVYFGVQVTTSLDICVFLVLQPGQILVSLIDDQDLTGHGCPCLADVHLYVIFNWPQSIANQ